MISRIRSEQDRWNSIERESKVQVMVASQTGFTPEAEILNGRLAMIGFVSLLTLSVMSHHGLFEALSVLSNR